MKLAAAAGVVLDPARRCASWLDNVDEASGVCASGHIFWRTTEPYVSVVFTPACQALPGFAPGRLCGRCAALQPRGPGMRMHGRGT